MEPPRSGVWGWGETLPARIALPELSKLEASSLEQHPSNIINTPMRCFAEKFPWFCGRVDPFLLSRFIRDCHPEMMDDFGQWGKGPNLIKIL